MSEIDFHDERITLEQILNAMPAGLASVAAAVAASEAGVTASEIDAVAELIEDGIDPHGTAGVPKVTYLCARAQLAKDPRKAAHAAIRETIRHLERTIDKHRGLSWPHRRSAEAWIRDTLARDFPAAAKIDAETRQLIADAIRGLVS